jgi:acetolactate synthase I/II/III large subunit
MVMRIADYIMQRLVSAGVSHVFQVTGRGALFLSDALAKSSSLKAVSLHHEQSCAFAAVAYAEKRRGLGACLVSTGCASTNTMTGVLTAWQDGIPCIFISGQNILRETTRHTGISLRTYGQQEADIVSLVSPITKFAHMLTSPQDIVEVMDKALDAALTGRKGPVWLDVPLDLQSALIDPDILAHAVPKVATPALTAEVVERIAEDLRQAKRPVLLIGKGVRSAGAEPLLRKIVENWNIPLTYASSAPDSYGAAHRLSVGSVGAMGCSRAGNFAVQNADYVLVLGSRLTALTTGTDYCKFARSAQIAVVDIDPVEHSKEGIRIDRLVTADLHAFLDALVKQPVKQVSEAWVEKCLHWKRLFGKVEPDFDSPDVVDLYQLADRLSELMPEGATLVTDSGLAEVILPSNIRFQEGADCIHPASQGAMGFALPAAVGAQHATDGTVLAVIGDGSVMMNLQELESIRYQRLPIKLIVINNNVYSIIRRRQRDLFRKRTIGTDPENGVSCPDFAKVADCFGLHFQRIETVASLDEGLKALFAHPGPVLCEIMGREDQGYIEVGQTRSSVDRRLVRRPLEDQEPFLSRETFLREMIIDPIDQ